MADLCLADRERVALAELEVTNFLREALPHRAVAWDLKDRADDVALDAKDPNSLIGRLERQWNANDPRVLVHARLGCMAVQIFDAGLTLLNRLPIGDEEPDALWAPAAIKTACTVTAQRPWDMFDRPLSLDLPLVRTQLGPGGLFGGLSGLTRQIREEHPGLNTTDPPKPGTLIDLSILSLHLGGHLINTALAHMLEHLDPADYRFWVEPEPVQANTPA